MKERVGSYVIGQDGNPAPNLDDEAMAEREKTKPEVTNNGKE